MKTESELREEFFRASERFLRRNGYSCHKRNLKSPTGGLIDLYGVNPSKGLTVAIVVCGKDPISEIDRSIQLRLCADYTFVACERRLRNLFEELVGKSGVGVLAMGVSKWIPDPSQTTKSSIVIPAYKGLLSAIVTGTISNDVQETCEKAQIEEEQKEQILGSTMEPVISPVAEEMIEEKESQPSECIEPDLSYWFVSKEPTEASKPEVKKERKKRTKKVELQGEEKEEQSSDE